MRAAATLLFVLLPILGSAQQHPAAAGSCFVLFDEKTGNIVRDGDVCSTRLPPASTFKIPHAIAALDSGVITGADAVIKYDGAPRDYATWRHDHTLASAMRYSVVWYFQEIARRLGMDRERSYLQRLEYGNADPSSGLTTFWLGESLRISPDEQLAFLRRLYSNRLPVSAVAMQTVRDILVQKNGTITNATGDHPFDAPWPAGTMVSAKTGSTSFERTRAVRWIVGRVERAGQAWMFVSCVTGAADLDGMAAVDLAARALRRGSVL
jgi:beta-lactamase class D